MNKIWFVGAGPGDPDLITVKGKEKLEVADVIVYAGSLVNKKLLNYAKDNCEIYNSARMTLEEVIEVMTKAWKEDKFVVRLHTGDPALFGAIKEQMDRLAKCDIDFEVVPGVSSFLAAASALKVQYTLPEVSQSVILTRIEGRTAVPDGQKIEDYAKHRASMVIFLSVHMIDDLVLKLKKHYKLDTKVAVVYKASWPEQIIVKGTLEDICMKVKENNITKTALILVGDFLGDEYALSKLYDASFTHEFRKGETK